MAHMETSFPSGRQKNFALLDQSFQTLKILYGFGKTMVYDTEFKHVLPNTFCLKYHCIVKILWHLQIGPYSEISFQKTYYEQSFN